MKSEPAISPVRESFSEMLVRLWRAHHTGPIIVNFLHGVPRSVEFPNKPMRIVLDTRASHDA